MYKRSIKYNKIEFLGQKIDYWPSVISIKKGNNLRIAFLKMLVRKLTFQNCFLSLRLHQYRPIGKQVEELSTSLEAALWL